uniref:Uncharacterized protein n=1 Tax=Meloidogyne enterolobii TaxID=390850 RepID=A0A6V7XBD8_MELEN|nr:unnamed protein product [Meloidogyne enterolobii]
MERLILNHIIEHLNVNNIIVDSQFGFMKKRSTTLQMLSNFNSWYDAILNNKIIDCIFIDIKSAFDSVP